MSLSLMTQHLITDISRKSYSGTPRKSSFSSVSTNVRGYVRALSDQQASINNMQYGQSYMIIVPDSVDLREGDKVTFEDIVYQVRGVARHNRGGFPFKRGVMERSQSS